jgi:hypothetical protein
MQKKGAEILLSPPRGGSWKLVRRVCPGQRERFIVVLGFVEGAVEPPPHSNQRMVVLMVTVMTLRDMACTAFANSGYDDVRSGRHQE